MKKPKRKAAATRARAMNDIRRAAAVITTEAMRQVIWDDGPDIDVLVDRFARAHTAAGYRSVDIQKRVVDADAESVLNGLDDQTRSAVASLLDRWYSRYLLATDVGFELGFAAAHSLANGGRR